MTSKTRTPSSLKGSAAKWWRECVDTFSMRTPGELMMLEQAALCLMRIEECQVDVKKHGLTVPGQRGPIQNPALREERAQRGQFAALCRSLGIHNVEDDK